MATTMTRIFLTGASGFIGGHLLRKLLERGDDVFELHRVTSKNPTVFAGTRTIIPGDLLDFHRMLEIMELIKPEVIIHLAALTPVRLSWLQPSLYELVNFNGTVNLLEAALKKVSSFNFIFACYDKDTRLLTKNGFKYYNDLSQGELVYTLNPVTAEIEMQPIDHVFTYDYSGELIYFKGKSFNLLVTPNHKMLIRDTVDRLIFEDAEKTEKRSIYKIPNVKQRENHSLSKIKVGDKEYDINDIFYLLGLYIGDGYSSYQKVYRENKSGLSRKEFPEQAKDKVTGQFKEIVTKDSNKKTVLCKCPRVFFCIPQKDKARKPLVETLTRCNLAFSEYEKDIYFSSEPFFELFKSCGENALSKTIPDWVFSYDSIMLTALFKGLMDSDGHRNRVLSTSSQKLVTTFTELCMRLGKSVHITERLQKENKINNRTIHSTNIAYLIYVHHKERVLGQSYNTAKRIQYDGIVWCVSVKNKNVFVERHGDVTFCGNSTAEVYGDQPDNIPLNEEVELRPMSPYAETKAKAENYIYRCLRGKSQYSYAIMRCNNTFGRPYSGYFVETVMEQMLEKYSSKNSIPIYIYNATHKRDYMFYPDHVNAYLSVLDADACGTFNAAYGYPISNENMVRLMGKMLNVDVTVYEKLPEFPRPEDQKGIFQDTTKLKILGWKPLTSREDAILKLRKMYD